MPINRDEILLPEDINNIHDTSMRLLAEVGVRFPDENAIDVFNKHAIKTDNQIVYLSEEQITKALQTAPARFTIHARNHERNAIVGNGEPVFAPAYGAPFLVDPQVGKRTPTLDDYHNLARLAHDLPNQDLSGHLMVEPSDIPAHTAHLHMLQACMLHSDKPFMGSTEGIRGARHTMDMAAILFGEHPQKPVTIGLINPISPLGYSREMASALMAYAQAHQPVIIASLVMAGSTGPITLAGVLAQQNAEVLAGVVLTQLINPGAPVVYGSTSTNIEMKSGALAIGSPELSLLVSAHAQLARHYQLPSRAGGALTDASTVDAQAGFESMFSLLTAVKSGVDLILHSAGILSSFLAFSFEKFVLDDEMCGMIRHYLRGIPVKPETLAYDVIAQVGPGGNFLMEMHTVERCRTEFWKPALVDRRGLDAWMTHGRQDVVHHARQRWQELLAEHKDPPLDEIIKRQLKEFVEQQEA